MPDKRRKLTIRLSLAAAVLGLCGWEVLAEEEVEPTLEVLAKHPVPQWLAEARFGITVNWGIYCVPAYDNEWYPRHMYIEDHEVYKHHLSAYGDPSVFGYKDFIPRFTAEQFDAEGWADLFVQAGARFAGLTAEHRDGFSLWASQINRWNAAAMGPARDVAGELTRAIRKRNLKVVTSFYHAANIQNFYPEKEDWDTADPQYGDLYGKFTDPALALERWLGKIREVIDLYQPDQLWFDYGLGRIPEEYRRRMAAYYYGRESAWGRQTILVSKVEELPEGVGIFDLESSKIEKPTSFLWQTNESIAVNTHCYTDSIRLKTAGELIHELIDVISKNGIFLLTVCPKADGSIPPDQRERLLEIGEWLKVNGEAIYGAQPWVIHGEGPVLSVTGRGISEKAGEPIRFTNQDIRFTAKGDILYLMILDWPSEEVIAGSLKVRSLGPDSKITMLGIPKKLDYKVHPGRELHVQIPDLKPDDRPCRYAYTLKLEGFAAEVNPFVMPDSITLGPLQGLFEGDRIRVENKFGRDFISFWDDPKEQVHWLMRVRKPGRYLVRGEFSAGLGPSHIALESEFEILKVTIPRTNSWDSTRFVNLGEISFAQPGVYHLTLRAADIKNWRPLNVYRLQFALQ